MKKVISLILCMVLALSLDTVMVARAASWSAVSGNAVTSFDDPAQEGDRTAVLKITGGNAVTTLGKSFSGITRVSVDVFGTAALSLCGEEGTALVTVSLADGLINGSECAYDADAWNKVIIYTVPGLGSYNVYLDNGGTRAKVYSGTFTAAAIKSFSVAAVGSAYIDNLKVENLVKTKMLSDEILNNEFQSSSAEDFTASITETSSFKYEDVKFNGETVFMAEDVKETTSSETSRYVYKNLNTPITGSAVYSIDIYAASTHTAEGAAEATDNDARLKFFLNGKSTTELTRLLNGYFYPGGSKSAYTYPEDSWFNLRVELVKELSKAFYYVTYTDDSGTSVTEEFTKDIETFPEQFKGLYLWFNNGKGRHGVFYMKKISINSLDEGTDDLLNSLVADDVYTDNIDGSESFYIYDEVPAKDYAYSFAVVGNSSVINSAYPEHLNGIYDWIIDNSEKNDTEFVFNLGGFTSDTTSKPQWSLTKAVIERLKGIIPYSVIRGGADGAGNYNTFFPISEYESLVSGYYNYNGLISTYQKFNVGNIKYLALNLDTNLSDELLTWADGIVAANPDRNVIVTVYNYLDADGSVNTTGSSVWDKLVKKHENIVLVLSGGTPSERVVMSKAQGDNGNTVTQLLIAPQGIDARDSGAGLVAMLYFSEDGKNVQLRYYSTVKKAYFGTNNQFSFELDVVEADGESESDAEITASGISFDVELKGVKSGKLIAALYDSEQQLLESKMYDAAQKVNVSFTKAAANSQIKIMWWNGTTLIPISNYEVIGIQVK